MKNKCIASVALSFATSMTGRIKPAMIRRVEKFLRNPNYDTWDDIFSIIIDGSGKTKTIWQAVLEIDPCFPRRGRTTDGAGNVVNEWAECPLPVTVVEAINKVCLVPPAQKN